MRTTDQLRRALGALVESREISLQQYNVLRILRGAGPDGLPTLDVAQRMVERTPGITRLIDKLEAKGLAERKRGPGDRRQVICCISEAGVSLLAILNEPMARAVQSAMSPLDEASMGQLIRLLDRIRDGLNAK